jgi:hypothetical protein
MMQSIIAFNVEVSWQLIRHAKFSRVIMIPRVIKLLFAMEINYIISFTIKNGIIIKNSGICK